MTIFAPEPENMVGSVPTCCPKCGRTILHDALGTEQKQFLIDATAYQEVQAEYDHLRTLDSLLRRYPGTRNPLVTSKLRKPRDGHADEAAVAQILDSAAGFRDFLERSWFDHSTRFPFILSLLQRYRNSLAEMRVVCPHCRDQYLILPDDYYRAIGFARS